MSAGLALIALPRDPGQRVDPRIAADVGWIERTFHVRVTAGYAATGHAAGGEHPLGLAVDIVPEDRPGRTKGTWDDVDRLAKWAEPQQNQPIAPFRWVGYTGDPNHGRGNHLHLSWAHTTTSLGGPGRVSVIPPSVYRGGPNLTPSLGQVGNAAVSATGLVPPAITGAGGIVDDGLDALGSAAKAGAQAALQGIWDAIGKEATYGLLWASLVGGGAALAVYGLIKALGAEEDVSAAVGGVKQAGLMAATRGAVK